MQERSEQGDSEMQLYSS